MNATILDIRLAGAAEERNVRRDLARLFALDRLPAERPQLVCHWHRDADGRLAAAWERDVAPDGRR
jgi:hypothetical protein